MKYIKLYESFDFNDDDFDFEDEQPNTYYDILTVIPEEFKKFLIENNALEIYCENLSKSKNADFSWSDSDYRQFYKFWKNYKDFFISHKKDRYIIDSFQWSITPQKYEYWKILNNIYMTFLQNSNGA